MKTLTLFVLLFVSLALMAKEKGTLLPDIIAAESKAYKMPLAYVEQAETLYDSLKLAASGLGKDIFLKAYKGYVYLLNMGLVKKPGILSIVDFSQSNRQKRFYIIDLKAVKLFMNTYVLHGKNSGDEMATSFSNVVDSYKSSLGFLITSDTYTGDAGYSLRFRGMEPGINDNVRSRSIIVHGSKFINEQIAKRGKVSKSLGCPAVPMAQTKRIINAIKGGTVYFIYHPNDYYHSSSPILNAYIPEPALLPSMPVNAEDCMVVRCD